MAKIIHDLKEVVDFDSEKQVYEKILRYYIWGGRESYIQRKNLTKLFADLSGGNPSKEPELSEWDQFIELSRKLLDAPSEIFKCCFVLREFSFRCLVGKDAEKDEYLLKMISTNVRLRQFITAQSKYLVRAGRLPRDFDQLLSSIFDEIKSIDRS